MLKQSQIYRKVASKVHKFSPLNYLRAHCRNDGPSHLDTSVFIPSAHG